MPLPKHLLNRTFTELVELIYKRFRVILFALQEISTDNPTQILLNPWSKFLEVRGGYKGYIIAEDKEICETIK